MKIKHTLKRNWKTISGRITETIFEKGEDKYDYTAYYTEDRHFFIRSVACPSLNRRSIFVRVEDSVNNNGVISYTYNSEEEAKKVMARIDEFTIKDETEFKEGDWVYVRDDYDEVWKKRIYLSTFPKGKNYKYVVVDLGYEEKYKNWYNYVSENWRCIKPYKEKIKIKTEDGDTIEILKEKAKSLWFNIKD